MHGLDLLLAFGARLIQRLVLHLDAGDFALHFLVPLSMSIFLALLILLLELANFLQLSLLFDLEDSLLR